VALGTAEDAERAIHGAVKAFEHTRGLPVYQRVDILEKVVKGLTENKEEIARIITIESGKPISYSTIEVDRCIFNITCAMEEAKRIGGEVIPMELKPWGAGRFALTQRFSIGSVLGISPFNFPLNLSAHKVAPALATGNTLILKPPSTCPGAALRLGRIVHEAGAAAGWVNIMPCRPAIGEVIIRDDRIKVVSFTGSPGVGYHIKAISGKKRVILELGGNAGVIVHGDAHLQSAVDRIVTGGYGQAGQSCIAVQRVYVQDTIYDDVLDRLIQATRKVRVGDPMDPDTLVGPMISEHEAVRVENWVSEAVQGGAKVMIGGQRDGAFYQPTILTNVRPEMKVSCLEVFAPVITVAPYKEFETAVRQVGDSIFGLHAGIFTQDIGRVWHAFNNLEVGGVIVNDVPTFRQDHMPYGGVKESGIGREGARYAIEETTELKIMVINFQT